MNPQVKGKVNGYVVHIRSKGKDGVEAAVERAKAAYAAAKGTVVSKVTDGYTLITDKVPTAFPGGGYNPLRTNLSCARGACRPQNSRKRFWLLPEALGPLGPRSRGVRGSDRPPGTQSPFNQSP